MKRTFLIVTVQHRLIAFMDLLESIYRHPYLCQWNVVAVCQGYDEQSKSYVTENCKRFMRPGYTMIDFIFHPDMIGPHAARLIGLTSAESEIWCNLDDDMLIVPQTHYEPIVTRLLGDRGVGFVSGNWARTANMLSGKLDAVADKYEKQAIVFTGGGLLYRQDVADIMLDLPPYDFLFDDVEWSLTAYIAGLTNYRYKGSLLIHRVATKGGRQAWVGQKDRYLNDPALIRLEPANNKFYPGDNNYKIPLAANLTPLAHALHAENYARKYKS